MNMDRYTQKAQDALVAAQGLAHAANHSSIEPLHILLALIRQPEDVVPAILAGFVLSIEGQGSCLTHRR